MAVGSGRSSVAVRESERGSSRDWLLRPRAEHSTSAHPRHSDCTLPLSTTAHACSMSLLSFPQVAPPLTLGTLRPGSFQHLLPPVCVHLLVFLLLAPPFLCRRSPNSALYHGEPQFRHILIHRLPQSSLADSTPLERERDLPSFPPCLADPALGVTWLTPSSYSSTVDRLHSVLPTPPLLPLHLHCVTQLFVHVFTLLTLLLAIALGVGWVFPLHSDCAHTSSV